MAVFIAWIYFNPGRKAYAFVENAMQLHTALTCWYRLYSMAIGMMR